MFHGIEVEDSEAVYAYLTNFKIPGPSRKSGYLTDLLSHLSIEHGLYKQWDKRTYHKAVEVWKTFVTSVEGCEELFSESGIDLVIFHAGLSTVSCSLCMNNTNHVALKILINMLVLDISQQTTIDCKSNLISNVVQALTVNEDGIDERALETHFLLLRLMFLLTVHNELFVNRLVKELGFNEILLKYFICLIDTKIFVKQTPAADSMPVKIVGEISKVFFNFASKASPQSCIKIVNDAEDYRMEIMEKYLEWLPPLTKLCSKYPVTSPSFAAPLSDPHLGLINSLMLFPLSNDNVKKCWFAEDYDSVKVLLDIFRSIVLTLFETVDDADDLYKMNNGVVTFDEKLTPLMILLCQLCKWDLEAREIIKLVVTPMDLDRTVSLAKGKSFAARLIGFMTSSTLPNTKSLCSELIYLCCDEDAGRFVAYVGYGNAAGFLFENGITANPADIPKSSTPKIQELHEERLNLITGQVDSKVDQAEEPELEMTDEEKEAEGERLYHLIEKLNNTGVIKTVFQ